MKKTHRSVVSAVTNTKENDMNIHEIKRRIEQYGEGNLHQEESSLKEAKEESALRDWFAGMVMCGDWACDDAVIRDLDKAAEGYYEMADAMMRARKKA